MSIFSDRLKSVRTHNNVTQAALGAICNVTQQTIGKWETGKATPDPETIVNISNYFGVTTDYLLGRTDVPNLNVVDELEINGQKGKVLSPSKNPPSPKLRERMIEISKKVMAGQDDPGLYRMEKVPSTPEEFEQAVMALLDRWLAEREEK